MECNNRIEGKPQSKYIKIWPKFKVDKAKSKTPVQSPDGSNSTNNIQSSSSNDDKSKSQSPLKSLESKLDTTGKKLNEFQIAKSNLGQEQETSPKTFPFQQEIRRATDSTDSPSSSARADPLARSSATGEAARLKLLAGYKSFEARANENSSSAEGIKTNQTDLTLSKQVNQGNLFVYAGKQQQFERLAPREKPKKSLHHVLSTRPTELIIEDSSSSIEEEDDDDDDEQIEGPSLVQVNPLRTALGGKYLEQLADLIPEEEADLDAHQVSNGNINHHHLYCSRQLHPRHICGIGGSHKDQLNHLAACLKSNQNHPSDQLDQYQFTSQRPSGGYQTNQFNSTTELLFYPEDNFNRSRSTFLFGAKNQTHPQSLVLGTSQSEDISEDSTRASSGDLQPLSGQINYLTTDHHHHQSQYVIGKQRETSGPSRLENRHQATERSGYLSWFLCCLLSRFSGDSNRGQQQQRTHRRQRRNHGKLNEPQQSNIMYHHSRHHAHPPAQFAAGQLGQPGAYYLAASSVNSGPNQLHYGQSILSDSSLSSSVLTRSASRLGAMFYNCCSKKCLIVSIMMLIIFIFIFVTGLSAYLNFLMNLSRSNLIPLSGRLKVETQGDTFNDQLINRTSREFQLKQLQYETILRGAFDRTQTAMKNYPNHLVKCEVYSFRPGSLWVYFRLFINKRSLVADSNLMRRKSPDEQVDRQFLPRLTQQTLLAGFEQLMTSLSNSSQSHASSNQHRPSRSSTSSGSIGDKQVNGREDLRSFDDQIIRLKPIIESIDLQSVQVTSEFDMLANQQLLSMSDNLRAPTTQQISSPSQSRTIATSNSDIEIPAITTAIPIPNLDIPTVAITTRQPQAVTFGDEINISTKKFTLHNYKENVTRPVATPSQTTSSSTNKLSGTELPIKPSKQSEDLSPFLPNQQVRKSNDKLIKLISGQPVVSQHRPDISNNVNQQLRLTPSSEDVTKPVASKPKVDNSRSSVIISVQNPTLDLEPQIQELWNNAINGNKRVSNVTLVSSKQRQITITDVGSTSQPRPSTQPIQTSTRPPISTEAAVLPSTSSTQRPQKVSPHQNQGGSILQPVQTLPIQRVQETQGSQPMSALVLNKDIGLIGSNSTRITNSAKLETSRSSIRKQPSRNNQNLGSAGGQTSIQKAQTNKPKQAGPRPNDINSTQTNNSRTHIDQLIPTLPSTIDLTRSATPQPSSRSTQAPSLTTSITVEVASKAANKPESFQAALLNAQTTRPGTSAFSGQWKPMNSTSNTVEITDTHISSTRKPSENPVVNNQPKEGGVEGEDHRVISSPIVLQGSQSPFAMPTIDNPNQQHLTPLRSHRHNSTHNKRINKLMNTYHLINRPNHVNNEFESHRVSRMRLGDTSSTANPRMVDDFFIATTDSASHTSLQSSENVPRRTQDPFAFDTLRKSTDVPQSSTTPLSLVTSETGADHNQILVRKKLFLGSNGEIPDALTTEPSLSVDSFNVDRAISFGDRQPTSSTPDSNESQDQSFGSLLRCQYYGCKAKDSLRFICLNHSQICDDFIDCNDESDELDCVSLLRHDSKSNKLSFSNGAGIIYLNRRGSLAPMCIDSFESISNSKRDLEGHESDVLQVNSARKKQELIRQINTIGQYACSLQSFSKLTSVKINHHDLVDDMNILRNSKSYHLLSILGESERRIKSPNGSFESYKSGTSEHEVEVSTSSECPTQRTVFVKCGNFECGQDSFSIVDGKKSKRKGVINDFPWLVKLYQSGSLACHGYLIDEMWIIASSECFANNGSSPSEWTAEISYEHYGNDDYQSIESNRRYIRALLFQPKTSSDVSTTVLAKLERPVRFSPLNRPICLPPASTNKTFSTDLTRNYKDCVTATLPLPSNDSSQSMRQDLLLTKVKFHKISDCLNGSSLGSDSFGLICLSELSHDQDVREEDATKVLICSTTQASRSRSKWTVVGFQHKSASQDFQLDGSRRFFNTVASQIDWIIDAMNPRSNQRRSSPNEPQPILRNRTYPGTDEEDQTLPDLLIPNNQQAGISNTRCYQFKCSSGECLSWSRICDGLYDCSSHEDEKDCH